MATVSDTGTSGAADAVMPGAGVAPASGIGLAVADWERGADAESKSDRYIARRLAAAGADYKGVALTTFLLGAGFAGGAWLMLGILVEHWIVPGGLSPALRWAWLAAAVSALAVAAARWLLPLVRYRVNLVYAARVIEREHPELHNDLVNTVLVKAQPDSNPEKVVRSLERRTAKQLAALPAETAIDRSVPLRLAYGLAAIVVIAGLYELLAPKSFAVSSVRLIAPWIGWAAPSRVRIEPLRLAWRVPAERDHASDDLDRRRIAIDGGKATLVRGRQLVVSADIRGLRGGEKPVLLVTPLRADGGADAALQTWRVEMSRSQTVVPRDRSFVAVLPDATRGLDHSVDVTIEAGDARSEPVRVSVVDAPAMLVREIRYAFPAYTRLAPETVVWQGDIRALEGTEVTVVAESNQPLDEAWIDFDCDGRGDLRFAKSATDLARVMKSFKVQLKADRTGPEHSSYRLLLKPLPSGSGGTEQVVADQLQHRIEVIADMAPDVAIAEPSESPLRVPPAAPVTVRVRANDPDFALVKVGIETRLQGGPPGAEIVLLDTEHSGGFSGQAQLVPERLGAGPGASLEYRAVAIDNRPQQPNVSHSPWQILKIDPSAPPRRSEPPPAQRKNPAQEQEPPGQGGAAGQAPRQGAEGDRSKDQGSGESQPRGDQDRQRDGQDATAEERQERKQEQGQKGEHGNQDGQTGGGQAGGQQQPQDGAQAGNTNGDGKNHGQGADQGQGVGARGDRQGGQDQQTGKRQPGDEKTGGGQAGGEARPGDTQAEGVDGQADTGRSQGRRGDQQRRGAARDQTVAADGTNDGEAMERILEHRREQESGRGKGDGQATERRTDGAEGRRLPSEEAGDDPSDGQASGKDGGGNGEAGSGTEGMAAGSKGASGDGSGGQQAERGGDQHAGEAAGLHQERDARGAGEGGSSGGEGEAAGMKPGADDGQAGGETAGKGEASSRTSGQGEHRDDRGTEGEAAAGGADGKVAAGQSGDGAGDRGIASPGEPGDRSGKTGAGGDAANRAGSPPGPEGSRPDREMEWADQDLAHARNAADLAVEHLRSAISSGRNDVLERLGWTREQALAFLERWEKMRRLADSGDPIKRGEFEQTVRSLGLRPDGVRSSREVQADARGGQSQGRRSRPPADYREQFKAYTQGTTGE